MSYAAFDSLARRVYLEVAMAEFGIPGKKPSISRAAILSGLTRKEVQRLLAQPLDEALEAGERHNRATRVISGWTRDADFLDGEGQPRPLLPEGEISFATLVRRYSGDIPARALLDELLRVGAIRSDDNIHYRLVASGYVPSGSTVDKLQILGQDVADLVDTIGHNLQHADVDPRYQRKVMYHSIPASAVPEFRQLSARKAQALLVLLDRWLDEHDVPTPKADTDKRRMRVGVGIHYFEEVVPPRDNERKKK